MDEQINQEEKTKNRKRERRKAGLIGFLGVILGAVIAVFALPLLYGDFSSAVSGGEETVSKSGVGGIEQMSSDQVNVTSDVTTAVSEVSDAVVGVFNLQSRGLEAESQGAGSGVIYKQEGKSAYIVTNNHVIEGANQIEVGLANEKRVQAELVGSDPLTDLAVLRIDSENVDTVAAFGNSDNLSVGEPAIAIGNPLGSNLDGTVTRGIISAIDRSIPVDINGDQRYDWKANVIQTDAAINPGNSGGALINIEGQVIGINSMKIAQSAVEGIGFAIPSNDAVSVIEDLEDDGQIERPQLGVTIGSLGQIPSYHWQQTLHLPKDVREGVFINSVQSGSSAAKAGLRQYDVITAINGQSIKDELSLRNYLYKEGEVGEVINITFYRDGEKQTTELRLGKTGERQA